MNSHQFIKTLIAVSFAITFPAQVMAMPNPSEFDTNGDGQVTAAEAQAGLATLFAKIDTNVDKYLSLAEVQAWRESEQVTRFTALDVNKNGKLELVELQVSTTTATTTTTTTATTRPRGHGGPEVMTEKLFKLLDSDSSGDLSASEFALLEPGKGQLIRHFADMDSDGDLKISETEFATPPAHGGPDGQGPGHGPRGGR